MSDIHEFADYRDFIKDRLAKFKTNGRPFSFQNIAQKIETTKSYLKLIVDKKRHASIEKILPLCKLFEMSEYEKQYFIFLFLKNTSKKPEIKVFFDTILSGYIRSWSHIDIEGVNFSFQESTEKERYILRNWIFQAIYELVGCKSYQHDPIWIQKILGGPKILSIEDIKNCLDKLVESGSLYKSKDGWKVKAPNLVSDVKPVEMEEYQRFKTGLYRTAQALDGIGKSNLYRPSRFQSFCLSASFEDSKELIKLYDELERKIIEIGQKKSPPEKIFYISNNIFSIADL